MDTAICITSNRNISINSLNSGIPTVRWLNVGSARRTRRSSRERKPEVSPRFPRRSHSGSTELSAAFSETRSRRLAKAATLGGDLGFDDAWIVKCLDHAASNKQEQIAPTVSPARSTTTAADERKARGVAPHHRRTHYTIGLARNAKPTRYSKRQGEGNYDRLRQSAESA